MSTDGRTNGRKDGRTNLKLLSPGAMNCTMWLKFELVRDVIPVLDTCKFEEVAIKNKGAMPRTMSNMDLFSTPGQQLPIMLPV